MSRGWGGGDSGYIRTTKLTCDQAVHQLREDRPSLTAVSILGTINDADAAELVNAATPKSFRYVLGLDKRTQRTLRVLRIVGPSDGWEIDPGECAAHGWALSVDMTTVPDGIGRVHDLEELVISNTALTRVPADVGMLQSLRVLGLDRNKLERLPAQLGNLAALQQLLLNNNRLTTLPSTCSRLPNLIDLNLSYNWLEDVGAPNVARMFVQHPKLLRLSFEYNNIGDFSCMEIYNLLKYNRSDACVELKRNPGYLMLPFQQRRLWSLLQEPCENAICQKLADARDRTTALYPILNALYRVHTAGGASGHLRLVF